MTPALRKTPEKYPRVDRMEAECPRCKGAFKFVVARWTDDATRPERIMLIKHGCGIVRVEIDGPAWSLLTEIAKRARQSKSSKGKQSQRGRAARKT